MSYVRAADSDFQGRTFTSYAGRKEMLLDTGVKSVYIGGEDASGEGPLPGVWAWSYAAARFI